MHVDGLGHFGFPCSCQSARVCEDAVQWQGSVLLGRGLDPLGHFFGGGVVGRFEPLLGKGGVK